MLQADAQLSPDKYIYYFFIHFFRLIYLYNYILFQIKCMGL